ncbi:MAG: DUF222 domain-containing protein [Jiangellaceae bacterium]
MFEDRGQSGGPPVVRAPFAALVARPEGRVVAERVFALAEVLSPGGPPPAPASRPSRRDDGEGGGLAGVATGPALATLLDDTDLAAVDDYQLVEVIAGWERQKAHAEARQLEAIAALTNRPVFAGCGERGEDPGTATRRAAASEISPALHISPGQARSRVELACELVDEMAATLAELRAGRIDGYRARVIAEETRPLEPAARRDTEAKLLTKAHRHTATRLRAAARKVVLAVDPAGAQKRHQQARLGRAVARPCPEPDGMASALIRLPAEDLAAFWTAVDAAARARKTPEEARTLDQLRADVLADLGWSALEAGTLGCCNPHCAHPRLRLPGRPGRAATVNITVALTTLIGLDETPAHLDGYGPITAETARRIAAHGTWRRLLTDPATGAVLDVGRTRYTPPPDLAEHVIARDRTCRFPTCTWPARDCDLDHTTPFDEGGQTSAANLGPLHRGHHNGKTRRLWKLTQPRPGRFIWTSATGHTYDVEPEIVGLLAQPPPTDPDPPPF